MQTICIHSGYPHWKLIYAPEQENAISEHYQIKHFLNGRFLFSTTKNPMYHTEKYSY